MLFLVFHELYQIHALIYWSHWCYFVIYFHRLKCAGKSIMYLFLNWFFDRSVEEFLLTFVTFVIGSTLYDFKWWSPFLNLLDVLLKSWKGRWLDISNGQSGFVQKNLHVFVSKVFDLVIFFLMRTCREYARYFVLFCCVLYSEKEILGFGLLTKVLSIKLMQFIVLFAFCDVESIVPFLF